MRYEVKVDRSAPRINVPARIECARRRVRNVALDLDRGVILVKIKLAIVFLAKGDRKRAAGFVCAAERMLDNVKAAGNPSTPLRVETKYTDGRVVVWNAEPRAAAPRPRPPSRARASRMHSSRRLRRVGSSRSPSPSAPAGPTPDDDLSRIPQGRRS